MTSSPEEYELVVAGVIGERTVRALGTLVVVSVSSSETRLRGSFVDQSALHGALERIRDLGLVLLDVHRLR